MILKKYSLTALLSVILGGMFSPLTYADIVLSGTRIIYKAGADETTIRMENRGTRPLLVQTWLDTGDDNADPSTISVPFTATPPVSRIEPTRGQTVKIMYSGTTSLPADRESVYWFNALEIPGKAKGEDDKGKNLLQLAFRTRIKLFYRPEGLPGRASEAPAKITWQLRSNNSQVVLHAVNPTPYYVSFSSANVTVNGKKYTVKASMVAPKSDADFAVNGLSQVSKGTLEYRAINDFGGSIAGKSSL
ncbi:fimbrial chaperone [Superficieibacter sp. HKU1]|uniref:fimbrial chaperone n=1 Tax=Superficieibacter sp. HKU1 TaxID=3031919 RepID=UPI0023E1E8AC|nr:fimbrial chaperone [Superficieibacter sp. HKU1]WES68844.1 fimbrial chaperone [Superficieibacter sp. HKU1]